MANQQAKSWPERTAEQDHPVRGDGYDDLEHHARKQGFHNAHTSLGVAGHFVHMGAMLFPVLAAELINDAVQYKRAVRIGAVLTTVAYESLYTLREARRREQQEEKLADCRSRK